MCSITFYELWAINLWAVGSPKAKYATLDLESQVNVCK